MEMATIRESITDSIRYWEPRRIVYNLLLAVTVVIYYVRGLPFSKSVLTLNFVLILFVLAVIANVAYCAAYLVDIFAQGSGFRETLAIQTLDLILNRNNFSGNLHAIYIDGLSCPISIKPTLTNPIPLNNLA